MLKELRSEYRSRLFQTHPGRGAEVDETDKDASANLVKNETTSSDDPIV